VFLIFFNGSNNLGGVLGFFSQKTYQTENNSIQGGDLTSKNTP